MGIKSVRVGNGEKWLYKKSFFPSFSTKKTFGASATSIQITTICSVIRFVCTENCFITIGINPPTATSSNGVFLKKNEPHVFLIDAVQGVSISVIRDSTSGTLFISEADVAFEISEGGMSGDVNGPSSSTDNAVVRFDGTTGKLIKDSSAILDNAGKISVIDLNVSSLTALKLVLTDADKNFISSSLGESDLLNLMGFDFGDGSDSDVTISGNTTLARRWYYNNLTIDAGVVLTTAGFPIFVKGTFTNNGTIRNNGGNGSTATTATGASGGTPVNNNSETGGSGSSGGPGRNGAMSNGSNASPSGGSTFCMGGAGGTSGNGGNSGANTGGSGIAAGTLVYRPLRHVTSIMTVGSAQPQGGIGGSGGAGGAGDSVNSGGGGGGGGAGGGVQPIFAKTFVNNGTIECNGGNGGNGANGLAGDAAGGGGGGGGGGGWVYIIAGEITTVGTITANGGTKGSGGIKSGSGSNGSDGTNGSSGRVMKYEVKTKTWS